MQQMDVAEREDVLLSVVYSSAATVAFGDAELAELLALSRLRNAERGLTGLLLHRDGQFMQVLEGPEAAVRRLLAVIAADPRHTGVWVIDEEPIGRRRFASWAMAYRSVDDDRGQEWFGSDRSGAPAARGRAGELLTWFRER